MCERKIKILITASKSIDKTHVMYLKALNIMMLQADQKQLEQEGRWL